MAWVEFESTTTEFCWDAITDWVITPWVQLALRFNFVQLLFHLFAQFSHFIFVVPFVNHYISFKQNVAPLITLAVEWIDTYAIQHWKIFRSSYRKLAWVGFEPTTTEICSDAPTNWAIKPWVQLALRANFVQLLLFHLLVQFSHFISAVAFVIRHICFKQNVAQVITLAVELIDTYGIQHWRIYKSSYRNLAWVGFEPMTSEFYSDALTIWAIRPRVQLTLRANFVQLLPFHLYVQFSHFILAVVFAIHHICFERNLAQVITLARKWIDAYGIQPWRIFRSSYSKLAWVGFESTTTDFHSDALDNWVIRSWVQFALIANLVELLLFHLFLEYSFILAIALVSCDICFKRNVA